MRPIHERLLASAKRLAFLAGGFVDTKQWKKAETLSLSAVGMLMFLVTDEATPQEIRSEAENLVDYQRGVYEQARSEWLKKREDPKMSGKRSSPIEREWDEMIEMLQITMRDVQEEMKES